MTSRRYPIVAVVLLTCLAALACAAPTVPTAPTATATPTLTQAPSATPVPTQTALPSATPTPTASATPLATATASPSPAPTATTGPAVLKIVSDLPLFGDSTAQAQGLLNAERLRLAEAHYRACDGRYTLELEDWDDSSITNLTWDPAAEMANANRAAADPAVVVYLGPYQSSAARVSIPILDQSGPLVMISAGSTVPSLTKPDQGSEGEPQSLYPAGTRNFARVVSSWELEGTLSARYAHEQFGAKTAYVLDDSELYGQQQAAAFVAEAGKVGLSVSGQSSYDSSTDLEALMKTIAASNSGHAPDVIFLGATTGDPTPALIKAKVAAMGNNQRVRLIGSGTLADSDFVKLSGTAVEGMYFTLYGLGSDQYLTAGATYLRQYKAAYAAEPDFYAIYGYDAMGVALQAIENVCAQGGDPTSRAAVRDAVFAIRHYPGALGNWSFDDNGDTSLNDMTFYTVKGGAFITAAISRDNTITLVK